MWCSRALNSRKDTCHSKCVFTKIVDLSHQFLLLVSCIISAFFFWHYGTFGFMSWHWCHWCFVFLFCWCVCSVSNGTEASIFWGVISGRLLSCSVWVLFQ